MNIEELRAQLDEWEAGWTEEDDKFLGEFGKQPVLTDHYDDVPNKATAYRGFGPAKLVPYWELGLVVLPVKEEEAHDARIS